jgi:purine-binding chemotaxis protein CheW
MPPSPSTAAPVAARQRQARSAADKYLLFNLDGERYAVPILRVQEIIGIQDVTPMPRMPEWLRGVINLRGKVIPVLDLRRKLGLAPGADGKRTCIIVLQIAGGKHILGAVVDVVNEVQNIPPSDIEPAPSLGPAEGQCITGMAKVHGKVVVMLDVDRACDTGGLDMAHGG